MASTGVVHSIMRGKGRGWVTATLPHCSERKTLYPDSVHARKAGRDIAVGRSGQVCCSKALVE